MPADPNAGRDKALKDILGELRELNKHVKDLDQKFPKPKTANLQAYLQAEDGSIPVQTGEGVLVGGARYNPHDDTINVKMKLSTLDQQNSRLADPSNIYSIFVSFVTK